VGWGAEFDDGKSTSHEQVKGVGGDTICLWQSKMMEVKLPVQ